MRFITASGAAGLPIVSGRSSGVERNLAKVDVVSSNLIARSILLHGNRTLSHLMWNRCVLRGASGGAKYKAGAYCPGLK